MRFSLLTAWQAGAVLLVTTFALVLLYLLKPPRRLSVIPSSLLWTRLLADKKRHSERWRWWISLFLAIAIGVLLSLALARPETGALAGRRRLALVIDDSATMGTLREDGRSRLDHAIARARARIEKAGSGSEILVADTTGQIASSSFSDARAALRALDALHVSLSVTPFFPRFPSADADVFFLSDGVGVKDVPGNVDALSVFERSTNAGITAFEVAPVPAEPHRFEAYVEVVADSGSALPVELVVSGTGKHRIRRELTVEPGAPWSDTIELAGFEAGPLRASISATGDRLESDNAAYSFLPSKRRLRVTLVGENRFLRQLLALDPRIELTVLRASEWESRKPTDLTVLDRWAPESPPESPVLLFRSPQVPWLPPTQAELTRPEVQEWDRTHPLLHWVSLEDLIVQSAVPLEAGELEPVVGRAEVPLVVVGETPVPWVHVAFDLESSNFPLQPSFPIFFSNAVTWLTGGELALSRKVGPVDLPVTGARVTDLSDREIPLTTVLGGAGFDAEAPGLYTVSRGARRIHVAVNVASRGVTRVNDTAWAVEDDGPLDAVTPRSEPWVLLLAVAAGLLILEWLTYHRRLTL